MNFSIDALSTNKASACRTAGSERIGFFVLALERSPSFFDIGFLTAWFSRIGRDHPWNHRDVIDLKSYAAGKWGTVAPLKNEHIGHVLAVEDTSDHSALADARWTAEMFRELIA